ncbi:MAG TPA: hypothetical protein PKM65_06735 [Spirochaetota bacterium]|nr:hypothetical protein [Spirochaetota bacterium]HNT09946.1 hypothetical protein [Spirochaetota bacterium]
MSDAARAVAAAPSHPIEAVRPMWRLFPNLTHPTRIILIALMLVAGGYFLLNGETALGIATLVGGVFFAVVYFTNRHRGEGS